MCPSLLRGLEEEPKVSGEQNEPRSCEWQEQGITPGFDLGKRMLWLDNASHAGMTVASKSHFLLILSAFAPTAFSQKNSDPGKNFRFPWCVIIARFSANKKT